VVSGTDYERDPPDLRQALREHHFTWRKQEHHWEYAGRRAERARHVTAIRETLARLDAETAVTGAPAAGQAVRALKPLTGQQQEICDAAVAGAHLLVQALAGTGKTFVLTAAARAIADARPDDSIVYTSFTKSVILDARKGRFGPNVTPSTMHALARRALLQTDYAAKLGSGPKGAARPEQWAQVLGIAEQSGCSGPAGAGPAQAIAGGVLDGVLAAEAVAAMVMATIKKFRDSDAREPAARHLPPELATHPGSPLARAVVDYARKAWADISAPGNAALCATGGALQVSFDDYLKVWALSGPRIDADVVMFDECQPTGTQVLVPTGSHRKIRGQVTPTRYVPIESIRPGDRVVSYDGKGLRLRPTGSVVADVRSRPFTGRLVTVRTGDGKVSHYTPEHKCMAAIGPALAGRHVVYLMQRGASFRVGVAIGLHGNMNAGPRTRMQAEGGEHAWVLSAHATREEALAAEAYTSWRFGLPQMRFCGNARQQPAIDAFWAKVGDLTGHAEQCLAAHGRSIHYPLWSKGPRYTLTHRPMIVHACNLLDGMAVADGDALMANRSQRRIRDTELRTITVGSGFYEGLVWSLEVDGDHTYVADGLVTHNCQDVNACMREVILQQADHAQLIFVGDSQQSIYAFRGAEDSLPIMARRFPEARQLPLTQSWRFGPALAELANLFLQLLGSPLRLQGNPAVETVIGPVPVPDAIICRTNATAVAEAVTAIDSGMRVAFASDRGDDVIAFARAARDLKNRRRTRHPELAQFRDWDEVTECAYSGDDTYRHLQTFVRLIKDHGPDDLIAILGGLVSEKEPHDLTVGTVHQAKGLEWDRVRIAGDFKGPAEDPATGEITMPSGEELRGMYVAVTRARKNLDPGPLSWVLGYATAPAAATPKTAPRPGHTAAAQAAEPARRDEVVVNLATWAPPEPIPGGWLIVNAPRPVGGEITWEGEFRHGLFWAAAPAAAAGQFGWEAADAWPARFTTDDEIAAEVARYLADNGYSSAEAAGATMEELARDLNLPWAGQTRQEPAAAAQAAPGTATPGEPAPPGETGPATASPAARWPGTRRGAGLCARSGSSTPTAPRCASATRTTPTRTSRSSRPPGR
jgi:hypothetical protein